MSILRSPAAAPPLEVDDLLSEILLRLPPHPSSLPRVSLVCKRWRCLISDPGFVRRFRRHHRRNPPPLLGFFGQSVDGISFHPTMEPPNRVPAGRFSMPSDPDASFRLRLLGCRHGLVLMFDKKLEQVLVWDPISGEQHSLAIPPRFNTRITPIAWAVFPSAGDAHHFKVVLAGIDMEHLHTRAFACIYSSETGLWSDLISTLLPSEESTGSIPSMYFTSLPNVLVGGSLYWRLTRITGTPRVILEFDLDKQSLAVIHLPVECALYDPWGLEFVTAEGGGLGLLVMSGLTAQLWKMNTDGDGVASWVLGRTIELDKILSLNSEERKFTAIMGFAEYNNVIFVHTDMGLFMVQVESLQFKKISKPSMVSRYHPFESVYVAGNSMP